MVKVGNCAYCGGEFEYTRRTMKYCSDGHRQAAHRVKQDEESGLLPKPQPTPFAQVFMTKVLGLTDSISQLAKLTTQSRWKAFIHSDEGARARLALTIERDRLDILIRKFPPPETPLRPVMGEPSAHQDELLRRIRETKSFDL